MKTKLMIVLLCSLFVYTAAEAQWTMIPDNNFEQALIDLGIDDVLDGKVLTASVIPVTYLWLYEKGISEMTGIEDFINLEHLILTRNNLYTLDISNNTKLTNLVLTENHLNSIDVSNNVLLEILVIDGNNLESIDLSNNTGLEYLVLQSNEIENLDVSNNNNLWLLWFGANPIDAINLSNNMNLKSLSFNTTMIEQIDLSNNSNLELIECQNSDIQEIDLSNKPQLKQLFANNTNIASLDVSSNLLLEELGIGNTDITNIDLSSNPRLKSFSAVDGKLTHIDLSDKPFLEEVYLFIGQLTSVNFENSNNIKKLLAHWNSISHLDLSSLSQLQEVDLSDNDLETLRMDNGNNTAIHSIKLTGNPNLNCIQVDDAAYSTANWTNIDPQMYFSENCGEGSYTLIPDNNFEQALIELGLDDAMDGKVLTASVDTVTKLNVHDKDISDLTGIEDFLILTDLDASKNPISTINMSQNGELKNLLVFDCQLTTINVSNNPKLWSLGCSNNQLSEIDLSHNPILEGLAIDHNQLNQLDVSNNPILKGLMAHDNKFTSIDLSSNDMLVTLTIQYNPNLSSLNLKNGNNQSLSNISFNNCPNLTCIQVDDPAWSEANWTQIDPQMYFSEFCGATGDDSDGDGVPDAFDDYPMDETRAFDNYFPAAGYGSLGFEDLWPGMGDYDFNDVVVDYQFQCVTNAQNKVVEVKANFVLKASGASLRNGFGFNLPEASQYLQNNLSEIQVSGYHVTEAFVSLMENGFESAQSKPTIIVFDDFFNVMAHPGSGLGINTELDKPFVEFDTLQLVIQPSGLQFGLQDFKFEYWNPFIIVNNERAKEVHLPDYPPTDLADLSIFGTYEDNSNPGTGRYYKTANNLPWAIHIVEEFVWPLEKVSIVEAYRHFFDWAKSAGTEYEDWYKDLNGYRDEDKLYNRE